MDVSDIGLINKCAIQVIPNVFEWRERYETTRRTFLDPLGQEIIDLRLNLVMHFLQRHGIWLYYYRKVDADLCQFLSALFPIASSWLSSSPSTGIHGTGLPQQWKSCFQFQYDLALGSLFEFLRFCSRERRYVGPRLDKVFNWCRAIFNASSQPAPLIVLGDIVSCIWEKYGDSYEPESERLLHRLCI